MKDSNCIFCKIANGEIPSATIYEDGEFRVILDRGPATWGHALILPKEHFSDIYEIEDEVLTKAFVLAKKMAERMTEVLKCDGFNIIQNNGSPAGQTVFHFHIHLLPRYTDDGAKIGWKPNEISDEDLKKCLEQFSE
ncbi:HIT family protein [Anaerobium acetethylicum]|uniref:Histidine triad (HIT) family protein n=1 Tax=Anaerobium acetethylicum TaxID=1619234 RepID=A0A1D3TRJ8_9FIRM|nr:HIT family protein [Anaerobium acetethylicum]SCP96351.1 histidine triad (HIT) family protein [Anaerobium acetethylicum]